MKILITEKEIPTDIHRNEFCVSIYFIDGGSDHIETENIYLPTKDKRLEEYVSLVHTLVHTNHNHPEDLPKLSKEHKELFRNCFGDQDDFFLDEGEYDMKYHNIRIYIPQADNNESYPYLQFYRLTVTYFNSEGREFEVDLKKK